MSLLPVKDFAEYINVPDKPIEVLEPSWSGDLLLSVKTVWKTVRQTV